MKICFVTDGGPALGMGHVAQSTTFARELRERAEVVFLTKSSATVASMIREAGFSCTTLASDGDILRHLEALDADVVVFDKLDVEERLARDIRERLRAALVIFTNLTDANDHADVAVTADIGSRFENVSYSDERTGTLTYFGPKYWVLRREFYEMKRRVRARKLPPERLLLMFGGSDPANITTVVLDELLGLPRVFEIDLVLGAHFGHDAEVAAVLTRRAAKRACVTIHRNVKNVADLMHAADLVLASPGLSAFEALCVGTPVVVLPQDDLQRDTYAGFIRMLERHEVARLGALIEAGDFTFADAPHIARMQIGEGVSELVSVVMNATKRKTP